MSQTPQRRPYSTPEHPTSREMSVVARAASGRGDDTSTQWRGAGALQVFPLSRSAWSLAAIADGLAKITRRKPIFAVPDYMCNVSLWPLRQNRADLVFHPIEPEGLQQDWTACDRLPAIDAFMLVHYFGEPADAARARQWTLSRGARLIEDAAHVLRPISGVGEHGDFVIYSPRKLLPIPDGAFLVVRTPAAELLPPTAAALDDLGHTRASTFGWRMRRSRLSALTRLFPHRPADAASFRADDHTALPEHAPRMSRLAATLIGKGNLATVAEKRQRNAGAVLAAVAHLPGWAPLFSLDFAWVPHHLPMRCANRDLAERYFDRFQRTALTAETWPDLAPEVLACSAARRLRETVLLLPCHQHLDTVNLVVP